MAIPRVTPRLATAAVAGLLALTAAGCAAGPSAANDDGDPRTLRIAHNSNAAALPVQVAIAEGIFTKHDLKVEFTKVENIGTLPGTLGRSFDVALSVPTTVIAAAQQGIPVTQVSGATLDVEDNPTGFVIGSKKSGVTDIKQLAGKTLGVLTETGTTHTATKAWLRQEGVDPASVDIVQVDGPAQADQLAAGRVDAVETVMPFATNVLRDKDAVNLGDPYLKLAPELSAILWIAKQDFAAQHADVLKDFRASLDEAQEFIKGNDPKAREVLKDYTGLPDPAIKAAVLPTYTTEIRPDDLKVWLQAMKDVDGFKGDVDLDALVASQN
ncbi:MAG: transporter substrate-binding domain-containing protein [Actinophytocola sp.]|uniref:ABC transporter substrate-binding protein n=1 Tax=Actinophytocola sp. TaxID=1872138 RepID=UPI001320AF61|nr:ABC transporter substrate-binding protein [Actinophytocola sp.]MPZ83831.1 transporter substrate-binding domain-containing protein [Actinophytocola sp.]